MKKDLRFSVAALVFPLLLSGCATTMSDPVTAQIDPASKIGVIELFPGKMMHHKFGALAGISQDHYNYDAPFDVGRSLAETLVGDINAKTSARAVIIPASESLMATTRNPEEWGMKEVPEMPALFDKVDGQRTVKEAYRAELKSYAEKYGTSTIFLLRPYFEAPFQVGEMPGGYNFGLYTQDTWGFDHAFTFLFAVCLVVNTDNMTLVAAVGTKENAIKMKDYPVDRVGPPENMPLIEKNLHELVQKFSDAVVLRIASPQKPVAVQ